MESVSPQLLSKVSKRVNYRVWDLWFGEGLSWGYECGAVGSGVLGFEGEKFRVLACPGFEFWGLRGFGLQP